MQTGERAVMFVERERLGIEAFEIGAEHIEKLFGRRVAAFLLAFENHNLSGQISTTMSKLPGSSATASPW